MTRDSTASYAFHQRQKQQPFNTDAFYQDIEQEEYDDIEEYSDSENGCGPDEYYHSENARYLKEQETRNSFDIKRNVHDFTAYHDFNTRAINNSPPTEHHPAMTHFVDSGKNFPLLHPSLNDIIRILQKQAHKVSRTRIVSEPWCLTSFGTKYHKNCQKSPDKAEQFESCRPVMLWSPQPLESYNNPTFPIGRQFFDRDLVYQGIQEKYDDIKRQLLVYSPAVCTKGHTKRFITKDTIEGDDSKNFQDPEEGFLNEVSGSATLETLGSSSNCLQGESSGLLFCTEYDEFAEFMKTKDLEEKCDESAEFTELMKDLVEKSECNEFIAELVNIKDLLEKSGYETTRTLQKMLTIIKGLDSKEACDYVNKNRDTLRLPLNASSEAENLESEHTETVRSFDELQCSDSDLDYGYFNDSSANLKFYSNGHPAVDLSTDQDLSVLTPFDEVTSPFQSHPARDLSTDQEFPSHATPLKADNASHQMITSSSGRTRPPSRNRSLENGLGPAEVVPNMVSPNKPKGVPGRPNSGGHPPRNGPLRNGSGRAFNRAPPLKPKCAPVRPVSDRHPLRYGPVKNGLGQAKNQMSPRKPKGVPGHLSSSGHPLIPLRNGSTRAEVVLNKASLRKPNGVPGHSDGHPPRNGPSLDRTEVSLTQTRNKPKHIPGRLNSNRLLRNGSDRAEVAPNQALFSQPKGVRGRPNSGPLRNRPLRNGSGRAEVSTNQMSPLCKPKAVPGQPNTDSTGMISIGLARLTAPELFELASLVADVIFIEVCAEHCLHGNISRRVLRAPRVPGAERRTSKQISDPSGTSWAYSKVGRGSTEQSSYKKSSKTVDSLLFPPKSQGSANDFMSLKSEYSSFGAKKPLKSKDLGNGSLIPVVEHKASSGLIEESPQELEKPSQDKNEAQSRRKKLYAALIAVPVLSLIAGGIYSMFRSNIVAKDLGLFL